MRDFETGIVYVNAGTTGAETHLPFGGWKETGNGHREAGHAALDSLHRVEVDLRRLQRPAPARPDRQPVTVEDPAILAPPEIGTVGAADVAVWAVDLRKTFRVPSARPGWPRPRRSLFRREHREIQAVDGIGFEIEPGEVVGFLGPERRRQDDDAQDAQRPALPDGGRGDGPRLHAVAPRAPISCAGSRWSWATATSSSGTCRRSTRSS